MPGRSTLLLGLVLWAPGGVAFSVRLVGALKVAAFLCCPGRPGRPRGQDGYLLSPRARQLRLARPRRR